MSKWLMLRCAMRCVPWLVCALAACTTREATTAQPVTNGTPTSGHPAVFALVDDTGRVSCTATVIGAHSSITAAHCVVDRDVRTLRAAFGATIADAELVEISGGRAHPLFDATTLAHDVALLTLRDEAPATPIALDSRAIDASLVNTTFRVVGYGTTALGVGDGGTKREGVARISAVTADELTAVPDPSQPCRGDSGGPALLADTAVAAVVSRGDLACTDHATYARIDVARDVLVEPYLAETAPGTAQLGDDCLYEDQCAEGSCVPTHGDPLRSTCELDDAGCGGCASGGSPLPVLVLVAQLGLLELARRRARNRVHRHERIG